MNLVNIVHIDERHLRLIRKRYAVKIKRRVNNLQRWERYLKNTSHEDRLIKSALGGVALTASTGLEKRDVELGIGDCICGDIEDNGGLERGAASARSSRQFEEVGGRNVMSSVFMAMEEVDVEQYQPCPWRRLRRSGA